MSVNRNPQTYVSKIKLPKLTSVNRQASRRSRNRFPLLPSLGMPLLKKAATNSLQVNSHHGPSSKIDLHQHIRSIEETKRQETRHHQQGKVDQHRGQVAKYRRLVHSLSKQNEFLGNFVSRMYHQTSLLQSSFPDEKGEAKKVRKVRNLSLVGETRGEKGAGKAENKYDRLYEQLYEVNHGRRDLEELKKQIISSNLDKSLEGFFSEKKLRIPEFLRRLR